MNLPEKITVIIFLYKLYLFFLMKIKTSLRY